MESSGTTNTGESTAGNVETARCDQRYKIFTDYKEAFGENFDKLQFLNYKTGQIDISGSALRDAQTGCELYEKMGWDTAEHNSREPYRCGCRQFDEQLQFVSEEGKSLSNIDYRLLLEDGRTVKGRTDSDGKTRRIKSANSPAVIVTAEFFVPDDIPRCPGKACPSGKSDEAVKAIQIKGIETNEENVGSSLQTVTVKVKSRPLTAGEVEMARLIFKDSIDYSAVRVHNEEYLPFGLQDDETAMTPNGSMYFNPDYYVQDFSAQKSAETEEMFVDARQQTIRRKQWFMHEMTHVWQYQLGYSVTWQGFWLGVTGGYLFRRAYKYDYSDSKDSPDKNRSFNDFNMEQQAKIIERYYGIKYLYEYSYQNEMAFYERVLGKFLRSPKDASLLPK